MSAPAVTQAAARATALLELVASEPGLSAARACKRLGLARSELNRLLAELGEDAALGGLGLLRLDDSGDHPTLWLGARAVTGWDAAPTHAALAPQRALRLEAGKRIEADELLAEETPVALLFNGVPHVVMMCTPQDLDDLAYGFALSEGIVASAAELSIVDVLTRERGIALHLSIPAPRFDALEQRRRNLVGRSGCGLCGAETLDTAIMPVRRISAHAPVERARLQHAFEQLAARQPLNRACGSLHAAAALGPEPLLVREDVGRHNALDKVIGALARAGGHADALLVTSRASYELVHKTAAADVALLAAVSAPTALAVRIADAAGVTLVGFARDQRMTVYAQRDGLVE